MDPLLPSVASLSKGQGLSGLLSSMEPLLNGNTADVAAFANILQQNQSTAAPVVNADAPVASVQNAASQGTAPSNSTQTDPTLPTTNVAPHGGGGGGSSLGAIKKLITGLHQAIDQLKKRDGTKSTNNTEQSTTSQTANSDANTSKQTKPTQNASPDDADNTDETADVSSGTPIPANASGASTDPQTLTGLLSELVFLLQAVEKQLETAQSGAGTGDAAAGSDAASAGATDQTAGATGATGVTGTAGTTGTKDSWLDNLLAQLNGITDGTQPQTDPGQTQTAAAVSSDSAGSGQTSAADPLTQLLALVQAIEQKLGTSTGNALQAATANSSTPVVASSATSLPNSIPPDILQIQKSIKDFLTSLQNNAANGNSSSASAVGNISDLTSFTAGAAATAAATPSKTSDAAPDDKAPALSSLANLFNSSIAKSDSVFSGTASTDASPFVSLNANGFVAGGSDGNKDGGLLDGNSRDNTALSGENNQAAVDNSLSGLNDVTAPTNPYSFASQLSDVRATSGGTTGLPSVIDQVLLQLNRNVKSGSDQMTIQLSPADLGKINIKLDISSDGKVQGTVMADNPGTLNLLLKDVRGLERALQEAGLRADSGSLQFSLNGQSGNNAGQTANNSDSGSSSGNKTSLGVEDASSDISADSGETWVITPGRVNFKV